MKIKKIIIGMVYATMLMSTAVVFSDAPLYDVSAMDIIAGSKKVNAPAAYTKKISNEQDVVMVPLREIAKELGVKVVWEGKEKPIMVGEDASIQLGTIPANLSAAPELKDGITYVPLNFFKKVLGMNNAYVFEGQIVVDNEEEMH